MLGFGHGTTANYNHNRNTTELDDASDESRDILVSDIDSTTTAMTMNNADSNSNVSEMELEQQECFLVGDDDLGLGAMMDDDPNDEIGRLVKEVLMEFVMEDE